MTGGRMQIETLPTNYTFSNFPKVNQHNRVTELEIHEKPRTINTIFSCEADKIFSNLSQLTN